VKQSTNVLCFLENVSTDTTLGLLAAHTPLAHNPLSRPSLENRIVHPKLKASIGTRVIAHQKNIPRMRLILNVWNASHADVRLIELIEQ
jgi:hypothetical protein